MKKAVLGWITSMRKWGMGWGNWKMVLKKLTGNRGINEVTVVLKHKWKSW